MGYDWVPCSAYSSIPPKAVVGGNDSDGDVMYVGRSAHEGEMLVAKVVPAKHIAFVSIRGEALPKDSFEVLCGENLIWRPCYEHVIPENAVVCGKTSLDQAIYVGRGHYEGSLTVGRISSVHRALFIPFKGVERRLVTYEVLVEQTERPAGWVLPPPSPPPVEELPPPPPALLMPEIPAIKAEPVVGVKVYPALDNKPPPYALMPMPPPKIETALVPVPPTAPTPYEPPPPYPCEPPYMALGIKPAFGEPPANFVPAMSTPAMGADYTPAVGAAFIPAETSPGQWTASWTSTWKPSTYKAAECASGAWGTYTPAQTAASYDRWVHASVGNMPRNAVHAGHDVDLSTIFVCRSFHEGAVLPGKVVPNRGYAYVSYAGHEIPKAHFEVLVGEPGAYIWIFSSSGSVPPGAVEAGRTPNGEPLFVGRGHVNGSLTPGRIQPSHQCLYVPFGGQEKSLVGYEVLVRKSDYYENQTINWYF